MAYELEAGHVLDGRFKILELLCRGGMANIFKAIDTETGETVAVKAPLMRYESDPAFYSSFQRELEIGGKLRHPYITRIITVAKPSRPYIAMELLDGRTLGQIRRDKEPLSLAAALDAIGKTCEALEYVHAQGVVHHDLKPDNIMLCKDGSIRLLDFGLSNAAFRRLTVAGFSSSMGTPDYVAPEQVLGKRGDARTDLYSLGVILYELAAGVLPYPGDDPFYTMNARLVGDPPAPRQINPELSEGLEELILRAMARKPADRYQSAAAMRADLAAPEKIRVTGLARRLVSATPLQIRWRQMRAFAFAALIPVALVGLLLLFRKH